MAVPEARLTQHTVEVLQSSAAASASIPGLAPAGGEIISWNMQCSMKAAYGGSVSLTNKLGVIDVSIRTTRIQIQLDCDATVSDVSGTVGAFDGDILWVNGLVAGIEEQEAISERMVAFKFKSYYARLANKPLYTEHDVGSNLANSALTQIANDYAGIADSLYAFSVKENDICGPVQGSSMLEEMKNVAQAGEGTLFVNELGILVAEQWKDNNTGLEFTIPDEAIVSAQKSRNDNQLATCLKIRGCFFSEFDEGDQEQQKPGGGGQPRGKVVKCVQNGMPQEEFCARFAGNNLKGLKDDQGNAQFQVVGGDGFEVVGITIDETGTDVNYIKGSGEFMDDPDKVYEAETNVVGPIRNTSEFESYESSGSAGREAMARNDKAFAQLALALGGVPIAGVGGPAGGGGAPGKGGNKSDDKAPQERTDVQQEVTLCDPDLVEEFGIIWEEIENKYVPDLDTLMAIGIRRFQEMKMERNQWVLNLAYVPQLKLNQVVQFTTPPLCDGPTQTITGLLTSLKVNYNPDPKASMTAVVESFEDIGGTVYKSSNLIRRPIAIATDGAGVWSKSVAQDGIALVSAHCGELFAEVPLNWDDLSVPQWDTLTIKEWGQMDVDASSASDNVADFEFTQPSMEIGVEYVLTFDVTDLDGGSVGLDFSQDGAPVATYVVDGRKQHIFTATSATHTFRWQVTVTTLDTVSQWRVCNFQLTGTKVK